MLKTEDFIEKAHHMQHDFNTVVAAFKDDLWNYCRYLTGSPWDGEDIFQDTMVKAIGSFSQRWAETNPKSYLYRIATNTWIDRCRRERRYVGELLEENVPTTELDDSIEVEQALETLLQLFSPRQVAVFLLLDIFKFSAEEVAGIIKTTPGAVYATVQRVRKKLKDRNHHELSQKDEGITHSASPSKHVIQSYLKAFNEGNLQDMLSLMSDHIYTEASLGFQEHSKEETMNGSLKFGLPGYKAEEKILWGRPVIVVFADDKIHDIQYQEVENGKIVSHISYFFRKEFIFAAAKELGYEPQLNKPPVNWE